MTDDLVSWLTAQLDEDERMAQAAERGFEDLLLRGDAFAVDAHIARWDPARMLAEVAAKRQILGRHSPQWLSAYDADGMEEGGDFCECCDDPWPCADVLSLARPYAGRPGWRPEWAVMA